MGKPVPADDLPTGLVPAEDLPEAAGAPPTAEPLGFGTKAINMIGRGAWALPGLVGLDHETVQALIQATQDPAGLGGDFSSRVKAYKAAQLKTSQRVDTENPITSGIVRGAAAAPGEALTWLAAPEVKLPIAAGALEKALAYGPRFGVTGAAAEYGSTAHKPLPERVAGALEAGAASTAVGGGMAAALPNPSVLMPRPQFEAKAPRMEMSPAAKTLEREGVEGLTTGQKLPPESALAQIESVSTKNPTGLAPERAASRESFMRVAQNKGVAPGAEMPTTPDLQARLGQLFEGYGPAYDKIRGAEVPPQALTSLPEAASMPGRGVDARTAAAVRAEIENAMTVLPDLQNLGREPTPVALMKPARGGEAFRGGEFPPPPARGNVQPPPRKEVLATAAERAARREMVGPREERLIPGTSRPNPAFDWSVAKAEPPPAPEVTAGDLMKVRENIRESMRAAVKQQDFDRIRLLEHAEDVVTDALEKGLSPEHAAALRETDRQYARLMTAANAAPAGQTEFTPGQYLRQVEAAAGKRNFKKGEAGDLQDLGEAAREVFQEAPLTGLRGAVLGSLPGLKYGAAPFARWMNRPGMQEFLFSPRLEMTAGRPPMSRAAAPNAMLEALAEFLRSKGLGARVQAPALGEEENR